MAASVALDPTFALGHAALALLGHELCAPVDVEARLRDARLHARPQHRAGAQPRRRRSPGTSRGDSAPAGRHLATLPHGRPAALGRGADHRLRRRHRRCPQDAWQIVERCAPAYGDDWWFTGLLAFVRQEQGRFDEAMALSCRSLAVEPGAGHSAHARAHAHYETGDHAGRPGLDGRLDHRRRRAAPTA